MANNANKIVCKREISKTKSPESIYLNHVKAGENETRRKLKTKNQGNYFVTD
ncbi:hypothetical protein LEP1GSC005_1240 [Leptospira santarosai str. ST188]|nr:hypothetical protein LEP1GSC005_1240 [Leptospira santarosai str. ST188]